MVELIATPAARDGVIARLQDHFARNDLDTAGFESRVERAERATTHKELLAALDGLPPLQALERSPASTAAAPGQSIHATLSAVTRGGRWKVPPYVQVRAVFGSVELDLTDVEFPAGEVVLDCRAVAGSVTITVDQFVAVSCEGHALLGSFSAVQHESSSRGNTRRVRIVGRAVLGSVDVVVRKRQGPLAQVGAALDEGIRGLLGR
jgi:hypothetical protein